MAAPAGNLLEQQIFGLTMRNQVLPICRPFGAFLGSGGIGLSAFPEEQYDGKSYEAGRAQDGRKLVLDYHRICRVHNNCHYYAVYGDIYPDFRNRVPS